MNKFATLTVTLHFYIFKLKTNCKRFVHMCQVLKSKTVLKQELIQHIVRLKSVNRKVHSWDLGDRLEKVPKIHVCLSIVLEKSCPGMGSLKVVILWRNLCFPVNAINKYNSCTVINVLIQGYVIYSNKLCNFRLLDLIKKYIYCKLRKN